MFKPQRISSFDHPCMGAFLSFANRYPIWQSYYSNSITIIDTENLGPKKLTIRDKTGRDQAVASQCNDVPSLSIPKLLYDTHYIIQVRIKLWLCTYFCNRDAISNKSGKLCLFTQCPSSTGSILVDFKCRTLYFHLQTNIQKEFKNYQILGNLLST